MGADYVALQDWGATQVWYNRAPSSSLDTHFPAQIPYYGKTIHRWVVYAHQTLQDSYNFAPASEEINHTQKELKINEGACSLFTS